MSRIKVKNFGPIKEGCIENDGWIDIEKVTVFIGNQGSGKSTIAKLISTMMWIEKSVVNGTIKKSDLCTSKYLLHYLKYQRIDNYFKEHSIFLNGTQIIYEGDFFLITTGRDYIFVKEKTQNDYKYPKIMYVPDSRNFVSTVEKPSTLKNLPKFLFDFLEEYEKSKLEMKDILSLPLGEISFKYNKQSKTSFLVGSEYEINLTEASSGYQSYVPMFLVSNYLSNLIGKENDSSFKSISLEEDKRLKKEIAKILLNKNLSEVVKEASLEILSKKFKYSAFINIVEEPEQNLFPSSQRQILNSLLEFNNSTEANKLILTTHSPYIINYLSTAIQAAYLKNKIVASDVHHDEDIKKLNAIVPLKSLVDAKDVVIYQMDEKDGTIKKLPNYEGIPSDKNYLNEMLADGNHIFDALLELEETI